MAGSPPTSDFLSERDRLLLSIFEWGLGETKRRQRRIPTRAEVMEFLFAEREAKTLVDLEDEIDNVLDRLIWMRCGRKAARKRRRQSTAVSPKLLG